MKKGREYKEKVYGEISNISKAISNAHRMEIIDFLSNGSKCVEDIANQAGITIANTSQHLQILKKERLVKTNKKGVKVFYELADDSVYKAWMSLRNMALSVSPFVKLAKDEFMQENNYPEPIDYDELDHEKTFLIDVRPLDEYESQHHPDATSFPIEELEDRVSEIPKDKMVIAYCRGMFCTYADQAVKLLQSKGYNARKIESNVKDFILN